MLDGFQSAIQGIRGAVARQTDAARHISQVGAVGVGESQTDDDSATRPVTPVEEGHEVRNEVDLEREVVEQIEARHELEANAAALQAQKKAQDHLLDLFA
jgi:flagellar basal body rod protein FlgC